MKSRKSAVWGLCLLSSILYPLSSIPPGRAAQPAEVKVGSKAFTESVILGELVVQLVRDVGTPAVHRRELGGTQVLFNALLKGEIDVYPEYTGTIGEEILGGRVHGEDDLRREL